MCILLMICIIGGTFLFGGLLFSRSVSTIFQLVVARKGENTETCLKLEHLSHSASILETIRR